MKRFPGATPATVKATMAQRCKDERNAGARRQKSAEN